MVGINTGPGAHIASASIPVLPYANCMKENQSQCPNFLICRMGIIIIIIIINDSNNNSTTIYLMEFLR